METNINGIKINYTCEGDGDCVLLLHGWGANIDIYKGIIDSLKSTMKIYALDLPGMGKSSEPQTVWCVDDYLDFIIDFITSMGIKKLSLIGHSFGGRIIIKMMNRQDLTFEIDKIVLMDSAGIRPKLSIKKRIRQRYYKVCKWILNIGIVKWFYPDSLDRLRNRFGSADYNNASPIMRAILVKVVNEDLTSLIGAIDRPTLLIWGDKDTATPFSDAQKMNSLIKDSGIVKLEGAGHFSFLEQPLIVNKALNYFFSTKEG